VPVEVAAAMITPQEKARPWVSRASNKMVSLNYSSRLKACATPVAQPDCEERTLLRYELLIGAIERHMS
jgi:hypothetical protein